MELTKLRFLIIVNRSFPDELIKLIYDWDHINKSPYGNKSWYNGPKTWSTFIHGGIRVSDHWNFRSRTHPGIHCKTTKPIRNEEKWSVSIYDKHTDLYHIIGSYPKLSEKRKSKFISEQIPHLKASLKESTKIFYLKKQGIYTIDLLVKSLIDSKNEKTI